VTLNRLVIAAGLAAIIGVVSASAPARRELTRRSQPMRSFLGRHTRSVLLLLTLLCAGLQIWHIVAAVVPTSAVTALLLNRGERSPFQASSSRGFFEARWQAVQEDLLGNGARNYARNLSRRYVIHVVVAFVTTLSSWLLWRHCRRRHEPRWLTATALATLVVAGFLVVFTPLYYGVLLKSYQYPVVNLIGGEKDSSDDFAAELKSALSRTRFLIETTPEDLYLFDPDGPELHIVARDKVAMIKVVAQDFVFRRQR
jgi:hypothetical protein